jgi:hypothetical protein
VTMRLSKFGCGYQLSASHHFCNGAFGVKPLTVVPRHGSSLLSVVGPIAATRSGQEERASRSRARDTNPTKC